MAITVYRSTDASAPVMSGTIGSLITVLDACLVNGYGSMTAAGWTKSYSGTNLAVYRMVTGSGATGMYLRVDDTAAQVSRVRLYQTMSDVNTGTNPTPSEAQVAGGLSLRKSTTAAVTARPWVLIADTRAFYLFVQSNVTAFGATDSSDTVMFFGDIISNIGGADVTDCVIAASTSTATTGNVQTFGTIAATYSASVGHFIATQYTGLGTSWPVSKMRRAPSGATTSTVIGPAVTGAYPDPVTGGINLFAIELMESATAFRGLMPGMYEPYGGTNVGSIMDTFSGTGSLSGQTFILLPVYDSATAGRVAIRTNGTWY